MKVYKIRRIKDGLYSMGGTSPRWTKQGKTWNTIGHLHNHLNMFKEYNHDLRKYVSTLSIDYEGCEVVVYELEIAQIKTVSING
jgi:hypothetical protein